jgi:hypothetical protein
MRPSTDIHPLTAFFHSRRFTIADGMAWLQGVAPERFGRLISDNCIEPEDVAACDVDAVLRLARQAQFIPRERQLPGDAAIWNG